MLSNLIKKAILMYKYRYNRHRARAINFAFDFCRHNHVDGDYFEFGVYRGDTFKYAFHLAELKENKSMNFFAFDSFAGFSEPSGNDDIGIIKKGGRSCSEQDFLKIIKSDGVDLKRVKILPGWFEQTLEGAGKLETDKKIGAAKAAIIYIDCDLYEPAILSLDFITNKLVDGSIILFDNWFLFKGSPYRGERKAFTEWLEKNHNFVASEFHKFGWHGSSFIINHKL
jgi:hypothetical protein